MCQKKIINVILIFLAFKAHASEDINHELFGAIINNDILLVERLIAQSADVNCRDLNGDYTPMHKAIICGRFATHDLTIIRLLLDNSSNINAQNNSGWTPLFFAVKLGFVEAVKLLIQKGADVNLANRHGTTPLQEAAYWSLIYLVDVLLKAGANKNLKDSNNETACDIAKTQEIKSLIINFNYQNFLYTQSLKHALIYYIRKNKEKFAQSLIEKLPKELLEQINKSVH